MRLATVRHPSGNRVVRVEGECMLDLGPGDLGSFLGLEDWSERARAASEELDASAAPVFETLIPHPTKVVCVGLNYRNHIVEMGRSLPEFPTLFAKFPDTLIGAGDPILKPEESDQLDWEAELAVVIGRAARRARGVEAEAAIAGFTVANDVTCRDWQFRTREWTSGKNWDSTTPVGPVLVTPDELPGGVRPACRITTTVDGIERQNDNTRDLLFDPVALVEYVSTMVRLHPGDLILTGTPGGVGNALQPPVFLEPDQVLETTIEGIGQLRNVVRPG